MLLLLQAVVAALPSMIKLGVDVSEMIPGLKNAFDQLTGSGHLSETDVAELRIQVANAEAAWAEQVRKAEAELKPPPDQTD